MSHDLTLFGVGTSRTMRAHWMLLELGLDYESRLIKPRIGETLTNEFRLCSAKILYRGIKAEKSSWDSGSLAGGRARHCGDAMSTRIAWLRLISVLWLLVQD